MTELHLTDVELGFTSKDATWEIRRDRDYLTTSLLVKASSLVLDVDPGKHPEVVLMPAEELDEWRAVLAEWINTAARQVDDYRAMIESYSEYIAGLHDQVEHWRRLALAAQAEVAQTADELERALHEATEGASEVHENETIPYLPTEVVMAPSDEDGSPVPLLLQGAFERRAA